MRNAIKGKRTQVDALSDRTVSIEKALEDIRNRLSANVGPVSSMEEKRERLELFNVSLVDCCLIDVKFGAFRTF